MQYWGIPVPRLWPTLPTASYRIQLVKDTRSYCSGVNTFCRFIFRMPIPDAHAGDATLQSAVFVRGITAYCIAVSTKNISFLSEIFVSTLVEYQPAAWKNTRYRRGCTRCKVWLHEMQVWLHEVENSWLTGRGQATRAARCRQAHQAGK